MGNHGKTVIGNSPRLADFLSRIEERLGADHRRTQAAGFQLQSVVQTARAAGPSIPDGHQGKIADLGQVVENFTGSILG